MQRCRELGYLNDEQVAAERAESLVRQGRAVGQSLRLRLRQEGFADQAIDQALEHCAGASREHEVLEQLVSRRCGTLENIRHDARQKRRLMAYLQRRGFSPSTIYDYFNERQIHPYADG
ncbi:MAG: RecX family transcriptional regulator [Desulfuromonadaceae bacterium]|nr:RecX family transcriptional regulator [Desulfuromonadaceae bacterium]